MSMKQVVVALVSLSVVGAVGASPVMAPRQVIPAAASTPGEDGSFWSTELVVFNPSEHAATVTVTLLPTMPEGAMGAPVSTTLDTPIGPRQTATVPDLLGSLFPGHPTGAVVVTGRADSGDRVDLVVTSRTWTPATSGLGSLGQGIPGVAWVEDGDLTEAERIVPGLETSAAFRTNLGLVNLSQTLAERFTVEVLDGVGVSRGVLSYTLGPQAHLQRNNILAELGLEGAGFSAVVRLAGWDDLAPGGTSPSTAPDFVTYASRIDRRSNDPSFLDPQPGVSTIGPQRRRLVPAVANTPGSAGTFWTSDVAIHNPGDDTGLFVRLKLIPNGTAGAAADPPSRIALLNAHQTLTLADLVGDRFPDYTAGALVVEGRNRQSQIVDLRVDSRTWTPEGVGDGSFGQGIPGQALLHGGEPVVIPGLEQSAAFRTNLGLVNASFNLRETFLVEVLDPSGASRGSLTITLNPWAQWQVNGVLGELGLEGGGFTAVVSVVETENLEVDPDEDWDTIFAAYGSKVDQLTGDPTYLAGVPLRLPPSREQGDWYDFVDQAPWYLCPTDPHPDGATLVTAIDRGIHDFGAEDHRTIVQEVDFPPPGDWNQVGLEILLECPESGLCDHWDRTASLQMVLNPDDPQDQWQYLELARYITPYRVGMCQHVDVTALAPLLTGTRTLSSWVDTWVGPGHEAGEGWRISYRFVFYPGEARQADEVVNLWGRRSVVVGSTDPDRTVDLQVDPVTVHIPEDATRVQARLVTSGHSFGNTGNCAEFCPLRQDLLVNGEVRSVLPWRSDCEYNPVAGQQGTWQYDRNGWCPGGVVVGHTFDLTDAAAPGSDLLLDYDVRTMDGEVYLNTSPGDDEPIEWMSGQVLIWRQ